MPSSSSSTVRNRRLRVHACAYGSFGPTTATNPINDMKALDTQYEQIRTLGHGAFGSVLLARKRGFSFGNNNDVAIKLFRCAGTAAKDLEQQGLSYDDVDDAQGTYASFTREVDALLQLKCEAETRHSTTKDASVPPASLLTLNTWSVASNFCCILTPYYAGGTLRDELDFKRRNATTSLYAERRIHWYASQLLDAVAYAHRKGVAHGDIKSCNIYMDAVDGTLVLGDWGSAILFENEPSANNNTSSVAFTKLYAPPEMHTASEQDDFSTVSPQKIDSFALGAVLFELVCCTPLSEFEGEETLGEYIRRQGSAESALQLPQVRLPWLSDTASTATSTNNSNNDASKIAGSVVGYSHKLFRLLKLLLDCSPMSRISPSLGQQWVGVTVDRFSATVCPQVGSAVCLDNLYLGMLVQPHCAGLLGRTNQVGVVIRLDPDPNHTWVAFPSSTSPPQPKRCCIGANNAYEIKVAPQLPDYVANTSSPRMDGLVYSTDMALVAQYSVGAMVNSNCQILHREIVDQTSVVFFCAPAEEVQSNVFFTRPSRPIQSGSSQRAKRPRPVPDTWNAAAGRFIALETGDERQKILDMFYSPGGGMSRDTHEIVSIHAIQIKSMWDEFAEFRESVAKEYWSIPNDELLFHGTGTHDPSEILATASTAASFYWATSHASRSHNKIWFSRNASTADSIAYTNGQVRKMCLSTVALGRVSDTLTGARRLPPQLSYHSHLRSHTQTRSRVLSVSKTQQAYPEYIVTYKIIDRPQQQFILRSPDQTTTSAATTAANASASTPTVATTKQCVICMERPVRKILVPCGHACLCDICSSRPQLLALRYKCPECRQTFTQAMRFFGTLVEQDGE